MHFKLEVIGFNIESCQLAQAAGALRIELCDNPFDGGTTASYGFIKNARKVLSIDLFPIIRPRGGDFLYTHYEFEIMKADVQMCKDLGCDGVVLGILLSNGNIDKGRCWQLVQLAYPMSVTFHRAFDRTNDALKALEDVIEIGCERILTSGLKPTAPDGQKMLAKLVEAADDRIIIMPGSGVRSGNIKALAEQTGATEFHTSARTLKKSAMNYLNKAMKEKLELVSIDEAEIKKIHDILSKISS
ncbi:MAG: copper homeostasis protein CutC [Ferruginibacter sp.]